MQRISYTVLLILITLASCSGGGQYSEMRQRLDALNELNRADSVLTVKERNEAQTLADYFDSHGTPNDQLLAHYLLGRCYADMREAPMALHCYQEAITRADTLSPDCDFAQLSRVYGQSATIFYQQGLYRNQLEYEDLASSYAWRENDTLAALQCYAMKASAYEQLQMKDSAIFIYMDAISQMKAYNYNKVAAGYSGALAKTLIDKGEDDKALPYMIEHELYSGYFDDAMNISAGREVYYFFKGLYYLREQQLDSSEFFFRKELRTGRDFNNQNYGSRGLALLYQQKHMSDSAAKYALYAYDMNDSCFVQMTTHEVEQAKAMYDYSSQQEIAQQEKNKADMQTIRLLIVSVIALLLLIVSGAIAVMYHLQRKKRKAETARYLELQSHLKKAQEELEILRANDANLDELITKKTAEIADLQSALTKYEYLKETLSGKAFKDELTRINENSKYQVFAKKARRGIQMTEGDWQNVHELLKEEFPNFYHFITEQKTSLTDNEYHICLLTRLYISVKSCAGILGIDEATVTKTRKRLHTKLFKGDGDSKDFDRLLRSIHEQSPL
jgi:hypothetical protein